MSLLHVDKIHTYYDHIHAIRGVELTVEQGEIVTLIGSNGAGKSTTLNTICGAVSARQGRILFEGKDISAMPVHERVKLGITQVPEGRRIFARLTVAENLQLGGYTQASNAERERLQDEVFARFPRLKERRRQAAGTLSGGEQQMLAIGRALMAQPKLLLLDEPSMGLAPLLVAEIFKVIADLNAQGTTILLVEQNANAALSICHRGYLLQTGEVVLSGDSQALKESDEVQRVYLG